MVHGDTDAARLLLQMATLARTADDLVDEDNDKQLGVMTLLELTLIHIAGNPFYMKHQPALHTIITEMIVYWRIGDQYRKSEDSKKHIFGFVYRESTDRLAVAVAGICAGHDECP